jgi:hypothetical protein
LPQCDKPRTNHDTMPDHSTQVANRVNISGTSLHQLYLQEESARRAMDQCSFSPNGPHGYNSQCSDLSSKTACKCAQGSGDDCEKALLAQSQCYRDGNDAIHVSGAGVPNDSTAMVFSFAQ